MKIHFYKYQATGNDFILIDNRSAAVNFSNSEIQRLCDRRFGIGADGLMLIEKHPDLDFNLVYFNSDGSQSLCGNGSRAAVRFASLLGIVNGKATFNAYDGKHDAELALNDVVRLRMNDVKTVQKKGDDFFINTGSPHHVRFVNNVKDYTVFDEGRAIRYSDDYKPNGTNVNFVQILDNNTIFVRTYERGVENETLSCGTGIVAAALASSFRGFGSPVKVKAIGGELTVDFRFQNSGETSGHQGTFTDIFLTGPAKLVFEGDLEL